MGEGAQAKAWSLSQEQGRGRGQGQRPVDGGFTSHPSPEVRRWMGHPAQEATPAREATTEILDVVRNDALWGLVGVEILRVGEEGLTPVRADRGTA